MDKPEESYSTFSLDSAPSHPGIKNRRARPCEPFLTLTIKLRLEIYEHFIASFYLDVCQIDSARRHHGRWGNVSLKPAIYLQLIGTAPHCSDGCKRDANGALVGQKSEDPGRHKYHKHSPWAMARVCRTIHDEAAPLLDAIDIADVYFELRQFTEAEMRRWVTLPSANLTGVERVSRIRQWNIVIQGYCEQATFEKAKALGKQAGTKVPWIWTQENPLRK